MNIEERIEILRIFAELEDFDFIRKMSSEQLWNLMLMTSMILAVGQDEAEQESILDKIRAEIEQYNRLPSHYPVNTISIETALQIIDKYR